MNIPNWVPIALLVVGVLGFLGRAKFVQPLISKLGSPLGLKAKTVFLILGVLGIVLGGFAGLMGAVGGLNLSTASIGATEVSAVTGLVTVQVHDGLSNATTTEDFIDDSETVMTIYSADANIADGEEYVFNVTIERELISEDANIKVTCSIADKEISGVLANNLAEKTAGKIDLDINDGGRHIDDNTVVAFVSMSEGTGSAEVQIAFDQEETYHDGMVDNDDYVDTNCDANGVPFKLRVYADA